MFISALLLMTPLARAITAAEHASHHPSGAAAAGPAPAAGPAASGMAGGMGKMMEGCCGGKPPGKEFYPSLMDLPSLTEKQRSELQTRAHDRMKSGAALMNRGIVDLTGAVERSEYQLMREATALIQEGLGQFESGVSTHRALVEGKTPPQIGLDWYKRSLRLVGDDDSESPRRAQSSSQIESAGQSDSGISFFHGFLMIFLSIFAAGMVAMYFFKMKRAANLLGRLGGNVPGLPTQAKAGAETPAPAKAGAETPAPAKPASEAHPALHEHGPAKGLPTHWKGQLRVANIYTETGTVKTFRFVNPGQGELPFTYLAGQFLTLSVKVNGKPVKRSYSIASHPCEHDALELTIKREDHGLVSRYMHDVVREGDLLDVEGANGNLTFAGLGERPIVLIGGGVGITPLMSVLRCMISCGMTNTINLIYACKSISDFMFRDELEFLRKRHPNLHILIAIDHLEGGYPGAFEGRLTKERIEREVPEISNARVHLCGPPALMEAVGQALKDLKVPDDQIKTEAFAAQAAAPAKGASAPAPAAAADTATSLTFKKAGKTIPIPNDKTVLETAEEAGIEPPLPFQCRVGTCGVCKLRLLSGEVEMEVEVALSEEDKKGGLILTCQAKAQSNLEIEEP